MVNTVSVIKGEETTLLPQQVLVVHNDPSVVQKVRGTLETQGYRVIEAASHAKALEVGLSREEERPRLLVLQGSPLSDIPYRELMRLLGGSNSKARPCVLILTGKLDTSGLYEYNTVPDLFLNVPFNPAELLKFVEHLIGPAVSPSV